MQCMHGLGWTLEQVYKITTDIELYTNHKISIPGVTIFNAVTAQRYSRVGESCVDQKIEKLERQTPKNLP